VTPTATPPQRPSPTPRPRPTPPPRKHRHSNHCHLHRWCRSPPTPPGRTGRAPARAVPAPS
jgi:hypothetical protein